MHKNQAPELQPAGAGLPTGELIVAQVGLAMYRWTHSREQALAHFRSEREKILKIVEPLPARAGTTPVLINRIAGIEDSSRYWSPYMVLHHLVIVDGAIIDLIEALLQGRISDLLEVKIANVKPNPASDQGTIEQFKSTTTVYAERVAKLGALKGSARHRHPWFGQLDAHGWHCLAAVHHTIHRRQLEAIMALREFWGKF